MEAGALEEHPQLVKRVFWQWKKVALVLTKTRGRPLVQYIQDYYSSTPRIQVLRQIVEASLSEGMCQR
jgi:hypothetical protein